jgi:predicted nucleic acid-binding protein
MVAFAIDGAELELPRNLALLDTNILVALAYEHDPHHLEATLFVEEQQDFVLGVPPPVIVEACSFLIGKLKRRDRAEWLLQWLLTPGTGVRLLPAPHGAGELELQTFLGADSAWMALYKLDYVDAFLMQMANRITIACTFKPDLVIVTKDLTDFFRCFKGGYAYRVYDISSNETYDAGT